MIESNPQRPTHSQTESSIREQEQRARAESKRDAAEEEQARDKDLALRQPAAANHPTNNRDEERVRVITSKTAGGRV